MQTSGATAAPTGTQRFVNVSQVATQQIMAAQGSSTPQKSVYASHNVLAIEPTLLFHAQMGELEDPIAIMDEQYYLRPDM